RTGGICGDGLKLLETGDVNRHALCPFVTALSCRPLSRNEVDPARPHAAAARPSHAAWRARGGRLADPRGAARLCRVRACGRPSRGCPACEATPTWRPRRLLA